MASASGTDAASVSIERRIVREATERFARETRDNALWSLFIEHVRRAEAAAAGAGAGATSSELSMLDVYLEFDASVRAALDALGANYVRIVSRAVDDEPDLPDVASTRKGVLGDIVAQASTQPVAPIGADVTGSGGHPVGASLLDKVLTRYGDGGSGGNASADEQLYAELRAEQQSKLAEVVAIASGAKAVHENAAQQLDPVVTAYENVVDAAKFAVALDDYLDDTRTAAELVAKETARASAALGDARAALIEKLGIAVPAARDARKLSYIKQLEASVADVQQRAIDTLADTVARHDSERELRKRLGAASARMWQFDERRVRELATDAAATLARFIDRVGDGDVASAKAALAAAATVGTAVANAFLAASRLAAGPGVDADAAAVALPNTGLLTRVAGLAAGAERALDIVAGERRRVGVFNVETAQHEAGALVVRGDDGTDRAHIYVVVPLGGAAAVRDIGVWLWQRDAYVHVGAPDTLQPLAVPAGTAALVFDAKQSELLRGRRLALVGADWVLAFGAMAWPTDDTAAAAPKRPGFDVRVVKTQAPRRLRISSAGGEGSIVEGAAIEFGDVTDEVYWARLAPNIGGERTVEQLFDADGADAFAFPGLLAAGTDEAVFVPGADLAAAAVGDRFQLVRAQPSAATTATAPVGTALGLRSVPVLVEVLTSAVDV